MSSFSRAVRLIAACAISVSGYSALAFAQEEPADTEASEPTSSVEALVRAEEAITEIDYERSRRLAVMAITSGGLSIQELTRAYRVLSISSAQLEATDIAERAFKKLLALAPTSKVDQRLAPNRRSPVLSARGFWAVHKDGFALDVRYARRQKQVIVEVRDALSWGKLLHVWVRTPGQPYVKARYPIDPEHSGTAEFIVDAPSVEVTDEVEVYAFVEDARRNVMMRLGREREPQVFALTEAEVNAMLQRDIRGGQTGSYGRRLEELGVNVGVHGYASLEAKPVDETPSFDLHHTTVMLRADLNAYVSVEMALEWEHLGRGASNFYMPHGFIDLKQSELLVFRAGFFEAPIGAFNEYLYPDFLRITGLPPMFSRNVVPALWSEVGVQIRGSWSVGEESALTYALFVGNGLEQKDSNPDDLLPEEGGDIRSMRFNDRDRDNADKAFGGRIGVEWGDLDLGVSGYSGRYTQGIDRRLTIGDVDLSYRTKYFVFRAEGALARQEITSRTLTKSGAYALLAGRPIPHLQPYFQWDYLSLDNGAQGKQETQRALLGLAVYPFPDGRATRSLRLKSEAGYEFPNGGERDFVWFLQLTTGF